MHREPYLLAGQASELERLQTQSLVWEPAGRALLNRLDTGRRQMALDVGCGVLGWLRLLDGWVERGGTVFGTDIDRVMLAHAAAFASRQHLHKVEVLHDDLFASALPLGAFDLVHARFQLAPLGRVHDQLDAHQRLLRPGGWLVLEEPDAATWRVYPSAPAVQRLTELVQEGFRAAGGDFNAGRRLDGLLRARGLTPSLHEHVVTLEAGHPYLRLPLQFAAALDLRLARLVGRRELDRLVQEAAAELERPGSWGTTFTLVQAAVQVP
jgi:SAM-dependent methyltransferase